MQSRSNALSRPMPSITNPLPAATLHKKKNSELSDAVRRLIPATGVKDQAPEPQRIRLWIQRIIKCLDPALMKFPTKPEIAASEVFQIYDKMIEDTGEVNDAELYYHLLRAAVISDNRCTDAWVFHNKIRAILPYAHTFEDRMRLLSSDIELLKATIKHQDDGTEPQRIMYDLQSANLDPRNVLLEYRSGEQNEVRQKELAALEGKYMELYEVCIESLCHSRNDDMKAWYHEMVRLLPGYQPSFKMLIAMFECCIGSSNDASLGLNILTSFIERNMPQAQQYVEALLHLSIKACEPGISLHALTLLCETGAKCDHGTSIQLLNVASFTGHMDLAEYVFQKVVEWNYAITPDHCLAYVYALARASHDARAPFEAITQLGSLGLTLEYPQLVTLSREISSSQQRVDAAFAACKEIASKSKSLHIDALNVVVLAYANIGNLSGALEAVKKKQYLCPEHPASVNTYRALLSACQHPQVLNIDAANQILEMGDKDMKRQGGGALDMDSILYEGLILTYSRSGDVEKALNTLMMCLQTNITPTQFTFNSLIRKLARQDRIQQALDIAEGSLAAGLHIHPFTSKYVLRCAKQSGMVLGIKAYMKLGLVLKPEDEQGIQVKTSEKDRQADVV
jgi:hypothetical protein